jgi:hypothetical protein
MITLPATPIDPTAPSIGKWGCAPAIGKWGCAPAIGKWGC